VDFVVESGKNIILPHREGTASSLNTLPSAVREIIVANSENHTTNKNTMCERIAERFTY
jgi:hypothetical protein